MQRPIIVIGMGRSGTSLVASLIHRWGAYINEAQLIPADQHNASGYWEHAPLVRFNDNLLRAVSSSVFVPPSDDDYSILKGLGLHDTCSAAAKQLIASMNDTDGPWVWKDPRLALLLPFWEQCWRDALLVIAFRHPCDVARSLNNSGTPRPLSASLLLWQRSMMEVFRQTKPTSLRLVVSYRNLLTDPRRECERLSGFLNSAFGVHPSRDDERIGRMRGAVLENLQHHRQGADDPATSLLSHSQRRLAELLGNLASDVNVEDKEILQCELYPGWREYLLTCNAFGASLGLIDQQAREKLVTAVARRDKKVYGESHGSSGAEFIYATTP